MCGGGWAAEGVAGVVGWVMKHGRNICHREGCGYDLSGLEFEHGQVVCPECGEVNTNNFYSPFPRWLSFVLSYSKPWFIGLPIALLLALISSFVIRAGLWMVLPLAIVVEAAVFVVILLFTRKHMLREVMFTLYAPEWAWNAFFIPTMIWSTVYWGSIALLWMYLL